MQGISTLRGMPNLIKALRPWQPPGESRADKKRISLKRAQNYATFAEKEITSGFPLLHAHTLVGAWGALEAAIEDMLVGLLMNEPELLQGGAFARIRISLADFQTLDKEDRMRLVLEEVGRGHGTATKHGVDTFESILDHFSLSGAVGPKIKKNIWEMNHVRNVIVHRASVADRRLVASCPWMKLAIGDKVLIRHEILHRYIHALYEYVRLIVHRLAKRYDVDLEALIKHNIAMQKKKQTRSKRASPQETP